MMRRASVSIVCVGLILLFRAPALAQMGRLTGQVKNDANDAVASATVLAENPDASPDSFKAVTDRKGRFAMIGLRPGVWSITVVAPDHDPARIAVRVSAARTNATVDVRLTRRLPPTSALNGMKVQELQARLDRANGLLAEGQPGAALDIYRELLARVPALTTLNLQIGRACRLEGDADCAVASFEAAVAGGAAREVALLELTELALDRGDVNGARAYADRLTRMAPESAQAERARTLVNTSRP
jgi:hypothetical protein